MRVRVRTWVCSVIAPLELKVVPGYISHQLATLHVAASGFLPMCIVLSLVRFVYHTFLGTSENIRAAYTMPISTPFNWLGTASYCIWLWLLPSCSFQLTNDYPIKHLTPLNSIPSNHALASNRDSYCSMWGKPMFNFLNDLDPHLIHLCFLCLRPKCNEAITIPLLDTRMILIDTNVRINCKFCQSSCNFSDVSDPRLVWFW